jgi:preprotein translocase subunit SecY
MRLARNLWLEISGMSAKHVYQQFKQGNREISGSPGPATYHLLNRYIPTAAAFWWYLLPY